MARIAVVDDHPAVLAGLQRVLEATPDLQPVLAVASAGALLRGLDVQAVEAVVVDVELRRGSGLDLCRRLKERVRPPVVVLYTAHAGARLEVSACVAGADAVVGKDRPPGALVAAVRDALAGRTALPDLPPDVRTAAMRRLEPDDVPVAAMRLAGTPPQHVAQALGIDRREVSRRIGRIVGRLRPAEDEALAPHPW